MNSFSNNIELINIDGSKKNYYILDDIIKLSSKIFWDWFLTKKELIKQIKLCCYEKIINAKALYKDKILIWYWICYLWWKWWKYEVEIDNSITDLKKNWYLKTIIVDSNTQWKWFWNLILNEIITTSRNYWDEKILLHAWDGSPNNSSIIFFSKNWAKFIKKYKNKWYEDSLKNWWKCSKCWNPCYCSSIEMIIDINN